MVLALCLCVCVVCRVWFVVCVPMYLPFGLHTHSHDPTHRWLGRLTHMNVSLHTYEWVMSHTWMSHDTHMNESCHTFAHTPSRYVTRCVPHCDRWGGGGVDDAHVWSGGWCATTWPMSRGPCLVDAMSHTNESYDIGVSHDASHMTYDIDISHTRNESYDTHITHDDWVKWHTRITRCITHGMSHTIPYTNICIMACVLVCRTQYPTYICRTQYPIYIYCLRHTVYRTRWWYVAHNILHIYIYVSWHMYWCVAHNTLHIYVAHNVLYIYCVGHTVYRTCWWYVARNTCATYRTSHTLVVCRTQYPIYVWIMTYVRVHRAGLGKVVETTVGLHLTSLLQCLT